MAMCFPPNLTIVMLLLFPSPSTNAFPWYVPVYCYCQKRANFVFKPLNALRNEFADQAPTPCSSSRFQKEATGTMALGPRTILGHSPKVAKRTFSYRSRCSSSLLADCFDACTTVSNFALSHTNVPLRTQLQHLSMLDPRTFSPSPFPCIFFRPD